MTIGIEKGPTLILPKHMADLYLSGQFIISKGLQDHRQTPKFQS